jgi:hypothetical protein
LHDSLELIQEAGNDKLHRVGSPSTLELALIRPYSKVSYPHP